MSNIVRVKKDARYFSASNEPFNDEQLSWEARGLMGYLLSKPNDWIVRMEDLVKKGPAGDYKIRRMIMDLRKHGYVNRIRIQLEGGTFEWETHIYESPSLNPNPSKEIITTSRLSTSGLPTSGASTSGLPTGGEPRDILSTNSPSTDEKNTEEEITEEEEGDKSPTNSKRKRDERLDHPAISGYKSLARLNVPIIWRDDVINAVGDGEKEIYRWLDLVKSWIGRGWNPKNVEGMLDSFKKVENNRSGKPDPREGKTVADRRRYVTGEYSEFVEY